MGMTPGFVAQRFRATAVMDISGYKIKRLLGKGGMANVFLAIQESLDRPVALKVLNPKLSATAEFSERFFNEGRIVASLNHTNIITIHDIGVAGSFLYISMEYVEGGDLRSRILRRVTPEAALALIETLGGCLEVAHNKGIVHRDVKPTNILFRRDGTPLLTDFGIAKELSGDQELTMTGTLLGSPHYLSPEQAKGMSIDGRTDIYSLGVILYEMLVGDKPHQGDSDVSTIIKHVQDPVPRMPSPFEPLQPLLDRMMAKTPDDRFENASAMVQFVRSARRAWRLQKRSGAPRPGPVEGKDGKENRESQQPPQLRRRSGHYKWVGLSVAVCAVIVVWIGVTPALREAVHDAVLGVMSIRDESHTEMLANSQATAALDSSTGSRVMEPTPGKVKQEGVALARAQSLESSEIAVQESPEGSELKPQKTTSVNAVTRNWTEKVLERAEQALAQNRLTKPETNSAFHYYQRVLTADSENQAAKEGLRQIAQRYIEFAQAQVKYSKYEKAQEYVVLGLKVEPKNPKLLSLRRQTERTLSVKRKAMRARAAVEKAKRAWINDILERGDNALKAYRLTTPEDNSAFHYYKRVLVEEPDNRRAKQGLAEIVKRYIRLAEEQIEKYKYKKARDYIALGLKVQPHNKRLQALKEEASLKNAPRHLFENFKGLFKDSKLPQ